MSKRRPKKDAESERYEPPEPGKEDAAHALARAGISSLPVIGGAGVELFSAIVQPPLERRRNEWMKEIGDGLRTLEDAELISFDDLSGNDVFIDTVLTASQIAMRTSQEEKKEALRNAIMNAALPQPIEESRQQFFLHLIDVFTAWHLRLLKLFQDPVKWFEATEKPWPNVSMGGLSTILETAYPELAGNRIFYDQVWKDINTYGLTRTDSLHTMMTGGGLQAQRASDLGNDFIRFIEEPEALQSSDASLERIQPQRAIMSEVVLLRNLVRSR
jgi:hypothetical protein